VKSEPGDHVARRHDEKKWLVRRPAFECDEIRNRFAIDSTTESIHCFGWIREHAAFVEMSDGARDCQLYFIGRPEWNSKRANAHSRKILRASARAKSRSVVIFIARSLPGTTTIGMPSRSQSAVSSVAVIPALDASLWAR
jgi:hypothetical protein